MAFPTNWASMGTAPADNEYRAMKAAEDTRRWEYEQAHKREIEEREYEDARADLEYDRKISERAYKDIREDLKYNRERQERLDEDSSRQKWTDIATRQGKADTDRFEAESKDDYYQNRYGTSNGVDRVRETSDMSKGNRTVRTRQIPGVTRAPQDDIGAYLQNENNLVNSEKMQEMSKGYEQYFADVAQKEKNQRYSLAAMLHSTLQHGQADEKGFIPVPTGLIKQYNAETGSNHLGMLISTKDTNGKDLPYYQAFVVDWAADQNGRKVIDPATGRPAMTLTPIGQNTLRAINELGSTGGFESLANFGFDGMYKSSTKNAENYYNRQINKLKIDLKNAEKMLGTFDSNYNYITQDSEQYKNTVNSINAEIKQLEGELFDVLDGRATVEIRKDGTRKFTPYNGPDENASAARSDYMYPKNDLETMMQSVGPNEYGEFIVESARKEEEARIAEEARKVEEARKAEEARKTEEARKAEEARIAEEKGKLLKLDQEYRDQYAKEGLKYYGIREDGTPKDEGWFGELKNANGDAVTELSATFGIDGKEVLAPLLVPTLTHDEVDFLVNTVSMGLEPTTDKEAKMLEAIHKKAATFAGERVKNGLSPFFNAAESEQKAKSVTAKWDETVERHKASKDIKERNAIAGELDKIKSDAASLDKVISRKRREEYKRGVAENNRKVEAKAAEERNKIRKGRSEERKRLYEEYKKAKETYDAAIREWDDYKKDQKGRAFTMDSESVIRDKRIKYEKAVLDMAGMAEQILAYDKETERLLSGSDEMPKTPDGIENSLLALNQLQNLKGQKQKEIEKLESAEKRRAKMRPILGNPGAGEHMDYIDSL